MGDGNRQAAASSVRGRKRAEAESRSKVCLSRDADLGSSSKWSHTLFSHAIGLLLPPPPPPSASLPLLDGDCVYLERNNAAGVEMGMRREKESVRRDDGGKDGVLYLENSLADRDGSPVNNRHNSKDSLLSCCSNEKEGKKLPSFRGKNTTHTPFTHFGHCFSSSGTRVPGLVCAFSPTPASPADTRSHEASIIYAGKTRDEHQLRITGQKEHNNNNNRPTTQTIAVNESPRLSLLIRSPSSFFPFFAANPPSVRQRRRRRKKSLTDTRIGPNVWEKTYLLESVACQAIIRKNNRLTTCE